MVVRRILTDGKYKLDDCTIIITCTKARKISVDCESSYVLSTIYSNVLSIRVQGAVSPWL